MRRRPTAGGWLVLITATAVAMLVPARGLAAEAEPPARELTATFEFSGPQGNREVAATILIDRVTPVEEAQHFRSVLEREGQRGLLAAIRGRGDGRLRLGAVEYGLDLIVAQALDDGARIVIVTSRPLRAPEADLGLESLDYPFGAARIEIDGFGRGEGAFSPTASLRIEADGAVVTEQYVEGEGRVSDVRKVR
jgi:hypothetical protein